MRPTAPRYARAAVPVARAEDRPRSSTEVRVDCTSERDETEPQAGEPRVQIPATTLTGCDQTRPRTPDPGHLADCHERLISHGRTADAEVVSSRPKPRCWPR